jgi:hypothetical protein
MRRDSSRSTLSIWRWWCLAALAATSSVSAMQVDIVDRRSGETLAVYEHNGRSYVIGEPGHEYEVRMRSAEGGRMLAVASIDGVNVITGQTAATSQSGYIVDAYGFLRIEGWRKSMSRTAAFYFTKLPNSYAARTGRPDNVGVIGVALFRERVHCCEPYPLIQEQAAEAPASADSAAGANARAKTERAERQQEDKLGTGHGRSEYSPTSYAPFERASDAPDEIITIYYDSRRNLIAQGIIPTARRYAERTPQAFPGGFVPDP